MKRTACSPEKRWFQNGNPGKRSFTGSGNGGNGNALMLKPNQALILLFCLNIRVIFEA